MKQFACLGLLLLTGCATTSAPTTQCLDARRNVERFTVLAPMK